MVIKFADEGMIELFKIELEEQTKVLNEELLALEDSPHPLEKLEILMRAIHSIKGAARVILLQSIEKLAHGTEDFLVAVKNKSIDLERESLDLMFKIVDLFLQLSKVPYSEFENWVDQHEKEFKTLNTQISELLAGKEISISKVEVASQLFKASPQIKQKSHQERILRVSAQNLNRLMGLAGESIVESRSLLPFSNALTKLKKILNDAISASDQLRAGISENEMSPTNLQNLNKLQFFLKEGRQNLSERIVEVEDFINRHANLTERLYDEVIESHMRPFSDCVDAFPRLVRDLSKQLDKKIQLEILGKTTPVDRDILQKLETPLSHLLRNAVDHGIESPNDRMAAGKPIEGIIRLEARHMAGKLSISISDDGRGIDIESLKNTLIEKKLIKPDELNQLSDSEILDFLFLPGFSTSGKATEISGRGMGLNIVQNLVHEVGGVIKVVNSFGKGLLIDLQLPLAISVIRTLLVEINGEPYAFPLAHIEQSLMISPDKIEIIENRQYIHYEGHNVGLIPACQILELGDFSSQSEMYSILVLKDQAQYYGIVVDRFTEEKELVVQELQHLIGKIPNISAGSLTEDGNPLLIIDVEEMIRSVDLFLSGAHLQKL